MTRDHLMQVVAARKAQMDAVSDRLDALKARIAPIVEMWDGLSASGRGVVSRLLPKLAEAIDALRDKEE